MRDWTEIVGEGLASRSHPDRYGKGIVWVAVQGSAWAQELRMRKETILQRLRERSGDASLFTDVRFGVRPLPAVEEPEVPTPESEPLPRETELTIREIAQRRLAKMRGE
jgi:predicted nucleic acid-binding Zn ribbon protein